MTSLMEFCQSTGRQMGASVPTDVAGQPIGWQDVAPWTQIQTPETGAVIFVAPEQHQKEFAPNIICTTAHVRPEMSAEDALHSIASTATGLPQWNCTEEIAGVGDPRPDGTESTYRLVAGTYGSELGDMATTSLLAAWNSDESTYVFQLIVTTFVADADCHEQGLDCVLIGDFTAGDIVAALRG